MRLLSPESSLPQTGGVPNDLAASLYVGLHDFLDDRRDP